jgi:hypothetical protein
MNWMICPKEKAVSALTPSGPWLIIDPTRGYVRDWENACSRSGT